MNKFLLAILAVFHVSTAFAADKAKTKAAKPHIICAISSVKDARNYESVKVDLTVKELEEAYSSKGLDLGKDNLSFDVSVTREGKEITLDVFFYENNHVQDEIGGAQWKFNTAKVKKGVPVVTEPLELDEKHLADFTCLYHAK